MKSILFIYSLVFVLIILTIVFWLKPTKHSTIPETTQKPGQATNTLAMNMPVVVQAASVSLQAAVPLTNGELPAANKAKALDLTKQFIEKRNVPIEFYGRVIDQDSNLLSGAKIQIAILHLTMPNPLVSDLGSRSIRLEQTSDADGRFEFHGETGEGFGVGITKDGYQLEPNRYSFGPTAGSYENPVVFKMWSADIHEKLITGSKSLEIEPDGRLYFINLTDGTMSEHEGGDLKVWVKRPDPITYGKRYDWACEVDAINGGGLLQETDASASMYQAPADGYTTSFSYKEDAVVNGWGDTTGAQRFYVRLNNGQEYGRISIELEAYYNDQTPGLIRLSYAINPSGSRILR